MKSNHHFLRMFWIPFIGTGIPVPVVTYIGRIEKKWGPPDRHDKQRQNLEEEKLTKTDQTVYIYNNSKYVNGLTNSLMF